MPATITCHGVPGTDTVTASLFPDGSDTAADTGLTFTRATNRKGTGSFSANRTGLHKIELRDASSNLRWYGFAILATSGSIEASDFRDDAINTDKVGSSGVAIATATQQSIADTLLDRTDGVETGRTMRQSLRLMLASLVSKLSGAATNTVAIRDTNDTKDRIVATVDADGNRTSVTLDPT